MRFALVGVLLLSSCATAVTSRPFIGPDGARWYAIECENRIDCLEEAGRGCQNGYETEREDGASMMVRCKASAPTMATAKAPAAAPKWSRITAPGYSFEIPSGWNEGKEKSGAIYRSPDGQTSVWGGSKPTTLSAAELAIALLESPDDQWESTVDGKPAIYVTGTPRIDNYGNKLRITTVVVAHDGVARYLTCSHEATFTVSKLCLRVLGTMHLVGEYGF